ncbi:hypothetical protein Q8W30_05395 [Neptunomonas phycophila]|uniref:PPM-type phosphatase domain-containing protein n=1 Tax=Neptunomonas phycophila TaxID=1572645 RepID=A0ABT9ESN1_9GAMM|nr:hypothetical protein [Neptunomonas phycophila]MDP2522001.1 hypothetical protein [Neptunomonas phycophila]
MSSRAISLSIKGADQDVNQDYLGHCIAGETKEFWVIADGSTNAKKSGAFVKKFCDGLRKNWLDLPAPITGDDMLCLMRTIHRTMQRDFICAKGSFLLLVIESEMQHCFHLGDCRIGIIEQGNIIWKTYPHSLAYTIDGADEERLRKDPDRHTLYKSLMGKRFSEPAYETLHLDLSKPFILASDGFWCQDSVQLPHLLTEDSVSSYIQSLKLSDDCTVLIRKGSF